MHRTLSLVAIVALGTGCPPSTDGYSGDRITERFPFADSTNRWQYQADDNTVGYWMLATQQPDPVQDDDGVFVYEVIFTYDCFNKEGICVDEDDDGKSDIEGEEIFRWTMSSDPARGVRFHSVDDTTYDPPVMLADGRMVINGSVTTESGGTTFTGTYEDFLVCPAERYWPDPDFRPDCVDLTLTDGDSGSLVAGEYWSTTRFGLVAFQRDIDGVNWSLKEFCEYDHDAGKCED